MSEVARPAASAPTQGVAYEPANIQSAYGVPAQTPTTAIAIVDAYYDPAAWSDMSAYRQQFGLPACGAGTCFMQVTQTGSTDFSGYTQDPGWASETALDLDAVSAMCPNCQILLVEAQSSEDSDLMTAVSTASALGAKYVSMSWGGPDGDYRRSELAALTETYFSAPQATYVASAGDCGYPEAASGGAEFPATSPNVVAAGGVNLRLGYAPNSSTLSAWATSRSFTLSGCESGSGSGAGGSGCSASIAGPAYQIGTPASACGGNRATSDMSALADPSTGLWIYDSGLVDQSGRSTPWAVYGGTSLAAPLLTALYAINGETAGSVASATSVQAYAYANESGFADVTRGSNCGGMRPTVLCSAGTGWDGPTGVGMPTSPAALYQTGWTPSAATDNFSSSAPVTSETPSSSAAPPSSPPLTLTIANPGGAVAKVSSYTGVSVRLNGQAKASDGSAVTYSARGLPAGTTFRGGFITGRPSKAGTYHVTVAGSDGPVVASASFTWSVKQNGFAPNARPRIVGTARRGRTVKLNAISWNTLAGARVKPKVSYQWYLNGRPIRTAKGASFRIPRSIAYKHRRLTLKITIRAVAYYKAYSYTTARSSLIS